MTANDAKMTANSAAEMTANFNFSAQVVDARLLHAHVQYPVRILSLRISAAGWTAWCILPTTEAISPSAHGSLDSNLIALLLDMN